jgi:hypothetical protein
MQGKIGQPIGNQNNQVKEEVIDKACSTHGAEGEYTQDFGEKARRKEPLEKPRHRWEDNIKMDLRRIRWGDMDWIHLAQERDQWKALENMVMNHQVP